MTTFIFLQRTQFEGPLAFWVGKSLQVQRQLRPWIRVDNFFSWTTLELFDLIDHWGNPIHAITNFINPGSTIAKSLILYVTLDHKINPVYAIHIIITIYFFLK
jgi:hypothetical protein